MYTPLIGLIYAKAKNGVIGYKNKIPWHLPEDFAHFKACTSGHAVVMGRKTWDSLPERFRPLPNRRNIVVSRQTNFHLDKAETVDSLAAAINLCQAEREIWIIGGAQIYQQALPSATRIMVTEIDIECEGDAFAPVLDEKWHKTSCELHKSTKGISFSFSRYEKTLEP